MTVRSGCDGVSIIDVVPIILVVGIFILFLGRLLYETLLSLRID